MLNLETFANLGEAVGGLAIVISLIYVGIELRRNTRTTRASTSYEGAHSWAEMNSLVMDKPELALIIRRSLDEESPSFTDEEASQLHFVGRSLMERLDGLFYLYRNKQLESELWEVRVTWARRWLLKPFWNQWWEQEKLTSNYSPSFLLELERGEAGKGPL